MQIPLPNDRLGEEGNVVIASVYTDDDKAEVLWLRTISPFYEKVRISLVTGEIEQGPTFHNIHEAAEALPE